MKVLGICLLVLGCAIASGSISDYWGANDGIGYVAPDRSTQTKLRISTGCTFVLIGIVLLLSF